jgi:hypothetical protein
VGVAWCLGIPGFGGITAIELACLYMVPRKSLAMQCANRPMQVWSSKVFHDGLGFRARYRYANVWHTQTCNIC